jgi:hypothetical protein
MTAKFRFKAQGVEIDWEGSADFLKAELPGIISSLVEAIGQNSEPQEEQEQIRQPTGSNKFTTQSLALKLKPNTAAELFKIALAKLHIIDGKEPASRNEIHTEMKSAGKFYKPAMHSNLSRTIASLLSIGEINEPSPGNFALSADEQTKIEEKI